MTLLNLYPVLELNVFQENLTGLAWQHKQLLPVFLWSFCTGWSLYLLSRQYWQSHHLVYPARLAFVIGAIMAFCPLIPYTFGTWGWLDDVHVWVSMLGTIGFIAQWGYVILVNPTRKLPTAWLILTLGFVSFSMAGFGQTVSGLAEIFYSESLVLVLVGALSIKKTR